MRDHRSEDPSSTLRWRKSSYSNQDGGDCVEIADGHPTLIPVRDSKSPTTGPLLIPTASWQAFIDALTR